MRIEEARHLLVELLGDRERGPGQVRLDLSGPIARLILDNPSARNAITLHMMLDLCDAVVQLQAHKGATLIVQSADPRSFCSGGHLKEVRHTLDAPWKGRCMSSAMGSVLEGLLGLPMVSVAALDGPAIGGGAEFATACDHRVFSESAWIHFVHARLGVAPGWGGAGRLVAHVGRRRALRILSRAERLDATEALRVHLADQVVTDSAVAGAEAFLAPLLELPAVAVRATKDQVHRSWRVRDAKGLMPETDAFAKVWAGPAHRDALSR
jgi:ethylmalonyl-CoA/methylmalonyl-CoA decarboxylase